MDKKKKANVEYKPVRDNFMLTGKDNSSIIYSKNVKEGNKEQGEKKEC
ncbi:hypothetical protein [Aneurinibacillus aneurinilyticus]|uniref:Uncharacterized protein n=1 Tax=Aneurinibacillus aneurinilyticus ATCC 12856 TaxID=649747 RepID=U1WF67_ANEAE|nr:hypothetical protein [Aneurinibacillus aneurinilyticus]ERI07199.1 hypothetical protein HMPREF0083_04670 [Aneurinibacillus aneurinilyticus ATCC 12856]MED0704799.1 hypothetical protein [Aneurinibacillus aneurinilyticus]MED0723335.1 hypothetical protein [Aneurinibacillus aneurinilyticus]MED0730350.1 hypothetical protein [Aneurinibacillus aneurinilyticus]MED0739179.1 hypothetical protein [Aneurinibacillus aneurinilyticus]